MKALYFKNICALLFLAMMFSLPLQNLAQTGVPQGFNYQAAVRDKNGALLVNKAVKLRMKFTDNSGANLLWQEDFSVTTTANGLVNVVLGNGTKSGGSASGFSNINWKTNNPKMETLLDADGSGNYVSMGTNNFWTVPYALVADSLSKNPTMNLNSLSDVSKTSPTTGQVLKWNGSAWAPAADDTSKSKGGSIPTLGGDISGTLSNVTVDKIQGESISSTAPTSGQVLKWNGTAWAPAKDDTTSHTVIPAPGGDVKGSINSMTVIKLQGNPIATTTPTTGQILKWDGTQWKASDTSKGSPTTWQKNGSNIYYNGGNVGINTSSPVDRLHIIENLSSKTEGMRVETSGGSNAGAQYYGIYSQINNTNGASFAVFGKSLGKSSSTNTGLSGYGSGSTVENNGIFGYGTSSSSTAPNLGVYGRADSSSNLNIGVEGDAVWKTTSGSTANYGSAGYATGSNTINLGVYGSTDGTGTQNTGVYGRSTGAGATGTTNIGTLGSASGGPANYGIYGTTSTSGSTSFAGYFLGNVFVSGTLSKSAGSFKIDHPQDPANKYLIHSFVESPDMMNVYNGNISTGADSLAIVVLPDYFEALNKDFRYQLTAMGDFAQAIVYKEVAENQFVIKTSKPNIKVSWQVTGVRHDPYALKYPIIPVVEKTGADKGKYLQPELYGQPKEKALLPDPMVPQAPMVKH